MHTRESVSKLCFTALYVLFVTVGTYNMKNCATATLTTQYSQITLKSLVEKAQASIPASLDKKGIPVVYSSCLLFAEAHQKGRFPQVAYLDDPDLEWMVTQQNRSPFPVVVNTRMWKKAYPRIPVYSVPEFLEKHKCFVLIDQPKNDLIRKRFADDSRYKVVYIGTAAWYDYKRDTVSRYGLNVYTITVQ